jgi:hypothetical protein
LESYPLQAESTHLNFLVQYPHYPNQKWLQSALGFHSPEEFEEQAKGKNQPEAANRIPREQGLFRRVHFSPDLQRNFSVRLVYGMAR